MAAQGIQNLGHTLQQQKKMSICNIDDQELLFIALSIPFVAHTKKETERNDDRHSLAVPKRFFLYLLCCTYAARSQQASWRKWHLRFLIQERNVFIAVVYTQQPPILCSNLPFFSQKNCDVLYKTDFLLDTLVFRRVSRLPFFFYESRPLKVIKV